MNKNCQCRNDSKEKLNGLVLSKVTECNDVLQIAFCARFVTYYFKANLGTYNCYIHSKTDIFICPGLEIKNFECSYIL